VKKKKLIEQKINETIDELNNNPDYTSYKIGELSNQLDEKMAPVLKSESLKEQMKDSQSKLKSTDPLSKLNKEDKKEIDDNTQESLKEMKSNPDEINKEKREIVIKNYSNY